MIEGIALSGYRGFGDEIQYFGPLSKLNIIIGQNNTEKSNILNFINIRYRIFIESIKSGQTFSKIVNLEKYKIDDNRKIIFGLCMMKGGENYQKIIESFDKFNPEIKAKAIKLLTTKSINLNQDENWFIYQTE